MKGRALTIYLDREVFSLLERKARGTGKSLSKVVQDALLDHLKDERRRLARQKILEIVRSRKKDRTLIEAWKEYERTERGKEREFRELFDEDRS